MSIAGIARTVGYRNREEMIEGLMKRHPVNARFLEGMLPTIDAIFRNVPGHLRGVMVSLTVDAFRRQSIAENTTAPTAEAAWTTRRQRAPRRVRRSAAPKTPLSRVS